MVSGADRTRGSIQAAMDVSTIIGSIAAISTTISFIPQAVKVIVTRDTRSISLWMYLLFSTGVALWLIYGIMKKDPPIILANGVTLCFAVVISGFKLSEKRRDRRRNGETLTSSG